MFTEEKQTTLEVMPNKFIKVRITTFYLKDGNKIGQDIWQRIIEPTPISIEKAAEFLDDYYMGIVRSVLTDEVVAEYALLKANEEK